MSCFRLFCVLVTAVFIAAAQNPVISNVANAASGILAPLPNAGIAQGSIFLILGSNLGPAAVAIAPNAFQTATLSGTSASITVGGRTTNALMYYTSATQVAVLLPSSTPVGTGTIALTYSGKTSAPFPITVVQNNLGIFTVSQNGSGPGIVTFADYSFVSVAKAANPGDVLILWGTGLGPVSADDASGPQPGNMATLPLKLWLGGVSAPIAYQGRSGCCIGEDQIVFTVPNDVPAGCAVPLSVQIGNQISNSVVLPVATAGRTCTPVLTAFPAAVLSQLVNGGSASYGRVELRRQPNSNAAGYNDNVNPAFVRFSFAAPFQPFVTSFVDNQPLGTCLVYNTLSPGSTPPVNVLSSVDIGTSLSVNGPNGIRTIDAASQLLSGTGNYLAPGDYTVSSSGGSDVPGFTASLNIPVSPLWTNEPSFGSQNSAPPVVRSTGATITWSGGSPNAYLEIRISSATDNSFTNGATVVCTAAMNAGRFTIPPAALLALPSGPNGYMEFKPTTNPVIYKATGLDIAFIQADLDTLLLGVSLQ